MELATKKKISILGATGSIGASTINLILENPNLFEVIALTANSNFTEIAKLAQLLKPKYIALADETKHKQLKSLIPNLPIISVTEAAEAEADIIIAAIVGIAGLKPTMAAIKKGKIIGLANKESMVCAGNIMLDEAQKSGAKIIPIDSEHNAIYQVLTHAQNIENITLTASGGPFLNFTEQQLNSVTPADALKHPKWNMGAKISIDSATMMNKGLEVIEAHYLFNLPANKINVVVHPESIIHSVVNYNDGASLAKFSCPDMRVPISYVLQYPNRLKNNTKRLDLTQLAQLNFFKPNYTKFRCLQLGYNALNAGASAQIALNAANEVAVDAFLQSKISFNAIANIIESALQESLPQIQNLDDVFALDEQIRKNCKI